MQRVAVLTAILGLGSVGCVRTIVTGSITDCATGKPLELVGIKMYEAPKDPNVTEFESNNWYRGLTEADGSFSVTGGSSEATAWALETAHAGYEPTTARVDVGETQRSFCLEPKSE